MSRPICFASDYGYADDFAGVCRGVIARLAPSATVIDVTHGLPRGDVLSGALVLRNTLAYMPDKAVHLAVVDPGVVATAMLVDRFGNVALNLDAQHLRDAGLGESIEVLTGGERYHAQLAVTFSSVRPSDIVVLIDSYGQAALAVNAGSACEVLGVRPGDEVELRALRPQA